MTGDGDVAIPTEALTEFTLGLAARLWTAASAVDPEWDYFGIFFWIKPRELTHIQECVTGGSSQSSWPGEETRSADVFLLEWWAEQQSAGRRMWRVMFMAGRRATGDLDSFLVYPGVGDQWDVSIGGERAAFDRAYERLGWQR